MTEDCDDLEKELQDHEEKSHNLFKEAEKLHQRSRHTSFAKDPKAMSEAFAKQREAIEEIQATDEIRNKLKEGHCEDVQTQLSD